jgi:hypothetical protein
MPERKKPGRRDITPRGGKLNAPTGSGRNAGPVNRQRPTPAVPPARNAASAPPTPACPECGKQFRTDEAVQTHRHAAHGTAATVVGDMTRCSECGSLVGNSNMATHRRRKHGML